MRRGEHGHLLEHQIALFLLLLCGAFAVVAWQHGRHGMAGCSAGAALALLALVIWMDS